MPIKLFDTLSRSQRELKQRTPETPFGMYCCGPTVYGPAHIGNFRTFLLQDVLRRTLEVGGIKVRHVRNITDVDDKTIRRSQEEGKPLSEFTAGWTKKFHEDCAKLNMLSPHVEPEAVAHIPLQIAMIEELVKRGNAYVASDGSVYFKVSSDPEYGKLARLDTKALRTQTTNSAGDANTADEYERDAVADFALWKARKPEDGENFWQSPWGEGRPGWHIECSAMSTHYLGETFDLHGGGVDLCFPHHENEIAQATCACGHHDAFAQHWFHSAHLMVDGAKMSKSLGNLYTLSDIEAKGFSPMALRYVLISGHYRTPLNFTMKSLEDANLALEKIEKGALKLLAKAPLAGGASPLSREAGPFPRKDCREPTQALQAWGQMCALAEQVLARAELAGESAWGGLEGAWEALCDDLNTAGALGKIFSALSDLGKKEISQAEAAKSVCGLAKILHALGLKIFTKEESETSVPPEVVKLGEERWAFRQAKNWAEADRLREELAKLGWKSLDKKDSYTLEKI